jgi:hypothetical protein
VDWSPGWKGVLVVFALLMTYLHSLNILGLYVTEGEYWWPVWTGMTAGERLLSYALALFANLGLMTLPFVHTPRRGMRIVLTVSLVSGILICVAWLAHDFSVMGFPDFGPPPKLSGGIVGVFLDLLIFVALPLVWTFYVLAIWMNLKFVVALMRMQRCIGK